MVVANLGEELRAVHLRHTHVRNDHIDGVLRQQVKSGPSSLGGEDIVVELKVTPDTFENTRFVVYT